MAHTALPIHPTLVHPRTGQPLRAVFVSERTGRVYWPVIGAADDDGTGGDGGGQQQQQQGQQQSAPSGGDRGYPEGTPLEQMNAEQQANYWKHQARKHEDRVKAFGKLTPEELATLRDKAGKHDALEFELGSEADKRAAAARKEAEEAKDALYRPMLAETALRVAIGDRKTAEEVDDFIGDLNLSRFLTDDGKVNTAKVLATVEKFAPATGNQQQQRPGPSANGQGNRSGSNRSTPGSNSVGAGRDLFAQMHPAKK